MRIVARYDEREIMDVFGVFVAGGRNWNQGN
jgi:NADH:ubiquinone oxidoreductase subunit C